MLKGVHITLLIGHAIPIAAPRVVMEALQSIQVTSSKERSGFQLTFSIAKNSPISTTMLPVGYFDPIITRVIIIVTLNGSQNVLMDGLVTNQELSPSNETGKSTLTITGEDISLAMDLLEITIPWPGVPAIAVINMILAKYLVLGVVPIVIPPYITDIKNPLEGFDTQKTTDRQFIKAIAHRVGFVFFIIPGPFPRQSFAYFGPDFNVPYPQSAVSINFDAYSNTESISFSLNGLAKQIKFFTIFDPFTGKIPVPIPVPNVSILKPPLGLRITPPARISFDDASAHLRPTEVAQRILGFMMSKENSMAISGNGSIDITRYPHIIRAGMLIGVRGTGITYDGYYYVDSVTHNIKKGEYRQNFTVSRDGLISNTPKTIL